MASQNDISARIATAKKEGFTDEQIYSSLASNAGFGKRISMAKKEGFSDVQIAQNLGLNLQKDLGQQKPIKVSASFKPFDWQAAQQKAMQDQAKAAGPTRLWESALLGASDLGAGVVQGFAYAGDKLGQGLNATLGTNFDTGAYDRFTNQRKDIQDFHQARRQQAGQGYDVARLGGQIAATAPLGALGRSYEGAAILSKAGAGVAAQNAAVGAAIGGAGFAENGKQRLENAALGGVGGAAGAAIGEKVGQGVAKITRSVKNTGTRAAQQTAQAIDKNLDDALRQQGMTLGDLSDDVANGLRKEARDALKAGKNLNPEAVARKAVLDQVGIKGTKGQVSGNAEVWQREAELAKLQDVGAPLREKFIDDNKQLANLLEVAIKNTHGNAVDQYAAVKSASDALVLNYNRGKDVAANLYNKARVAQGNDVLLDGAGLANDIYTRLDDEAVASFLPPDIAKKINQFSSTYNPSSFNGDSLSPGFLGSPDNIAPLFTLKKADEFIKNLNRHYKASLNANGQPTATTYALGIVRDAVNKRIDDAIAIMSPDGNKSAQLYQAARQAYKNNAQLTEQLPLLRDALKGIEPDQLFSKRILNGNVNELTETVKVLAKVDPTAIYNIKQQVLEFIASKAIKQNGQFSPAGMKSALDSISNRRLSILFGPDELKHIKNIGKAGEYLVMQPNHSYVNNSNTASATMNKLMDFFGSPKVKSVLNLPYLKDYVVDPISNYGNSRAVNNALRPDVSGSPLAPTPPTAQEQSLIDRLVQAGLLGGAGSTRQ